jgi:hypothetical protein
MHSPIQAGGGDPTDDSFIHTETHESRAESLLTRREYLHGIGLLLIVVFLWTSSNFITQVSQPIFAYYLSVT